MLAGASALRRTPTDLKARQYRLVRTLETNGGPDGAVFARVQQRLRELADEQRARSAELAEMTGRRRAVPVRT